MRTATALRCALLLVAGTALAGCSTPLAFQTKPILPPGSEREAYATTIQVNPEAELPVTWLKVAGPASVALQNSGARACTLFWLKAVAGLTTVTVAAENPQGRVEQVFRIPIAPALNEVVTPKIAPAALGPVDMGQTLTAQLALTAGTPPVTWTKVSGPEMLTVSPKGEVSYATTAPGAISFEVRATNDAGADVARLNFAVKSTAGYDAGAALAGRIAAGKLEALPGEAVLHAMDLKSGEALDHYLAGLTAGMGADGAAVADAAKKGATPQFDRQFKQGEELGGGLKAGTGSQSAARDALQQVLRDEPAAVLAWQAGFLKAYGPGAAAVYQGLVLSLQ